MAIATVAEAAQLAAGLVGGLEPRWSHVQVVGARAQVVCRDHGLPMELAAAAWLHDVGYSPRVVDTGLHPLDGARFLRRAGVDELVVSLVAHHTGAAVEAQERGLVDELVQFPEPPGDLLGVLTWVDLTTGPRGDLVSVDDRLTEILGRYAPGDPVHRAITRSSPMLRQMTSSAVARLGLVTAPPPPQR